MEYGNEYGPEHILEWIMQLIVLNMDVIVDEIWFKLHEGYIVDNLGSPDMGETLPKFLMKFFGERKKNYAPITLYRGKIHKILGVLQCSTTWFNELRVLNGPIGISESQDICV